MSDDRNLLFALIAMQTGLITRENLITTTRLWLQDKSQQMDQLLLSREFISEQQHGLLAQLVSMHIEKYDGDIERSLAGVDAISSVRDEIRGLGDDGLEQTLGHISLARESVSSDHTTLWTPPEPGQRFRILRPHAKGGLGIVYVAQDAELNREVALKEIQPEHTDNPDSRSRFVQEAKITGGLEHPGIVPVYGLGTHEDNRPYYAMRLIRGVTLKDAIDRFHRDEMKVRDVGFRRLEMRRLLARFVSVCNAIEYAHSRGILHRDIKPANVMLGKYGETLVVDWGLAKSIDRKEEYRQDEEQTLHPVASDRSTATQMGSAVGTPSYMSPEQAAGRLDRLGVTSDVYGLGATLYYLLTGEPSIAISDVGSAVRKAQTGDFRPPRVVNASVPRSFEAVCLKAMSLKPKDRYPSAAELSADVERLLADEPIDAYSESWAERLTRLSRRHRAWFRAGAAALMLLAIGSIVAALLLEKERQNTERERKKTADQLYTSNQLRLAAEASTLQGTMPQLALLLASESVNESVKRDNESVEGDGDKRQLAYEVLHATLAGTGGERIASLTDYSSGFSSLSPNGKWLSVGRRKVESATLLRLDSTATGPLQEIQLGDLPNLGTSVWSASAVVWSADGRWLACGDVDGFIYLYELASPDPSSSVRKWKAHHGPVTPPVFTPGGGRLISTSRGERECKIWELGKENPGGDEIRIRTPFELSVFGISPDASRLAIAGGGDPRVFIWDISEENPHPEPTLNFDGEGGTFPTFGPNGRYLAWAVDGRAIRLWDFESDSPQYSGEELGRHLYEVEGLFFTPDGEHLVSHGHDDTVKRFSLAPDAKDREVVLHGHTSGIYRAALDPTGQFLATASNDHTIRLWDVNEENPNDTVDVLRGHDGAIRELAFSLDGDLLYSGSTDGSVRAWRLGDSRTLSTRRMIRSLTGASDFGGGFFSWDVHHSHRGNGYLVGQLHGGQWRKWNLDENDLEGEVLAIPKDHVLGRPEVSNDGRWLLGTGDSSSVRSLIDLKSGQEKLLTLHLDGEPRFVNGLIDPNSRYFLTLDVNGQVLRWDLTSPDPTTNFEPIIYVRDPSYADRRSVCLSPDGRWLYAASGEGEIFRWDLDAVDPAASKQALSGHEKRVQMLAVSPDGRFLASSGQDRNFRIWQVDSLNPNIKAMKVIEDLPVSGLLFSPRSRYLAASIKGDDVIYVWSTKDEADAPTKLDGPSSYVSAMTFSGNGEFLACGEESGDICIWNWNVRTPDLGVEKQPVVRLSGHIGPSYGLRFFDDDKRLVSVNWDGTARIWELDTVRLVDRARQVAGRELTSDERKQFLGPASDNDSKGGLAR